MLQKNIYFTELCRKYEIMLKIITSMSQLNTDQLMAVYVESNRENAEEFFSDLNVEAQTEMAEREFLDYLREDFFSQKGAFYAVWVEDGVYKAALRLEPYKDGYLIEALETAPDERRKGYASKLITEVLPFLRSKNIGKVYSHVGKHNVASLRVHIKCGFQRTAESATYIDGTVTQNSCTLSCILI